MNTIKFMILMLAGVLFACGPGIAPEDTPEPRDTPVSVATQAAPNSPIVTPGAEAVAAPNSPIVTPATDTETQGQLAWNRDPNSRLLVATFCCGYVPRVMALNYIADATIWGDGRIIWVEQDKGARRVLQGQLTPEQVQVLLQQASSAGFFEWEARYANEGVADAAEQCLSINLAEQTKQVCEYFEGAPDAFHQLYATITAGAGVTGTGFVPERGYLTATPVERAADATAVVHGTWPAETIGFSLSEATAGRWIEGDILDAAWSLVNPNWQGMTIQEREVFYEISIQLPELSSAAPPPQ